MNDNLARFSTSEMLEKALYMQLKNMAQKQNRLKLRRLTFIVKVITLSIWMHALACSITEMDAKDGMTQVYRDMVLWADIVH
jgi:hypothetical protein